MRVVCNSVDDFLTNLNIALEHGVGLLQQCIRVNKNIRKIDEIRLEISLQLSAVMILPDGGEYIIISEEPCGKDYGGSQPEKEASKRLEVLLESIDKFCERTGLGSRPGVVDV